MALTNCKQCGRLFNRYMKDICPDCVKADENDFYKVSGFLRENRGASPQEVNEATGVSLDKIYRYIREGRLIATHFPNMTYPCERCGIPIGMGRFCRNCTEELKAEINRITHGETAAAHDPHKTRGRDDFYLKNRFDRR
ncbi:TIGR03826 family flagellar region protein [Effusibacillus lacus]|uniref:Flagellar protein n=1 Tax=Effusibacillus lacus TaxID=1348429 RepID=A0A292YC98_9BACL|nr:TIGR03826 family flagellar region protein [Effusibacillus lacus]TCS69810.1 flagellar operon protein (TIGR03826 family) [Effusibacillus lacus]GAX88892.1 hypothetical protein EFBL_0506 [Effusibacillus lacus]